MRHYGPQKVIDVIAAILNQITGQHWGDIYNGGSDAQRNKEYLDWVVWYKNAH